MAEERIDGSSGEQRPGAHGQHKKPYIAPVLTEYGTIAKLTQTSSGPRSDAAGMRPPCL